MPDLCRLDRGWIPRRVQPHEFGVLARDDSADVGGLCVYLLWIVGIVEQAVCLDVSVPAEGTEEQPLAHAARRQLAPWHSEIRRRVKEEGRPRSVARELVHEA